VNSPRAQRLRSESPAGVAAGDGESPAGTRGIPRAAAWLAAAAAANAEGAVYGAVMIGVLLAAEDPRRETYAETLGATALVVVLYWLTSLYTHILGVRLRTHEPLRGVLIRRSVVHELPIIEGAVVPMVVLVLAWATGSSLTGGVRVAVLATAVSIVGLEIAAGWRAQPRGANLWLRAAAGAVAGLAVVAVKVILHV
jgi:hypothetical protein